MFGYIENTLGIVSRVFYVVNEIRTLILYNYTFQFLKKYIKISLDIHIITKF